MIREILGRRGGEGEEGRKKESCTWYSFAFFWGLVQGGGGFFFLENFFYTDYFGERKVSLTHPTVSLQHHPRGSVWKWQGGFCQGGKKNGDHEKKKKEGRAKRKIPLRFGLGFPWFPRDITSNLWYLFVVSNPAPPGFSSWGEPHHLLLLFTLFFSSLGECSVLYLLLLLHQW